MERERIITAYKKMMLRQFFAALFLLLLPNLLLYTAACFMAVQRPWINVDYALLLLLSLWLPRVLLALGFLLLVVIDLMALVGQIFPVFSLSDALYILSFIELTARSYQLAAALVLLAALMLVCWFYRTINKPSTVVLLLVVNMTVLPYTFLALAGESVREANYREGRSAPFDSQAVYNLQRWLDYTARFSGLEGGVGYGAVNSLTAPLFDESAVQNDKVLLIVSESWGEPRFPVQKVLLAPLLQREKKLTSLSWGGLVSQGITVQGEIRELCNARLLGFRVSGIDSDFSACLPMRYRNKGFHTIAMHGAVGTMYERRDWYPRLGFEDVIFFESRTWPRRCYSFPGACDVDMMGEVSAIMGKHNKVFFYWLTLNSHYNYDPRDVDRNRVDCATYGIDETTQSCRNLNLHAQFFDALAELIDDPVMSGVRVLVVGDHDPVIGNKEEKERYFHKGKVAWLDFTVK